MTLVQMEIKKVAIRPNGEEVIIRPGEKWELLDETDFKNSSYSKNGYLQPIGWNNTSSFSATAYDTTNGRIYSTGSHSVAWLKFTNTAYNIIGSAKKLKIVYDYIFVANNSNTYGSGIKLPWALIARKSSGWQYEEHINLNYSPLYYNAVTYAVGYSGELVYDFESDTGTMTFTNLSDNTQTVSTLSGLKAQWNTSNMFINSSNGTYAFGGQYRDQGTTSYFGDMHIYYQV